MVVTTYPGMRSEIYVPITPPPVWTPVKEKISEMTVALVTAAGVHRKDQKRFNDTAQAWEYSDILDTIKSRILKNTNIRGLY